MFFKFKPLLYSLIFFFSLEAVIFRPDVVFYVSIFLVFVSAAAAKKLGKNWRFAILPVFFALASIILLYLITLQYEQQIFIGLASVIYYLSLFGAYRLAEYEKDQTAKGMIMAATSAAIFFTYAGLYGIYLNFLVPLYLLMIAYFAATLFISYQYFSIIKKDYAMIVWIYSLLLALVMTELIWTMNFWPFGYLTTGVIALILYYILWDIIESYFCNLLSKKRVVVNVIFLSIVISFVLLSSKWIPII